MKNNFGISQYAETAYNFSPSETAGRGSRRRRIKRAGLIGSGVGDKDGFTNQLPCGGVDLQGVGDGLVGGRDVFDVRHQVGSEAGQDLPGRGRVAIRRGEMNSEEAPRWQVPVDGRGDLVGILASVGGEGLADAGLGHRHWRGS